MKHNACYCSMIANIVCSPKSRSRNTTQQCSTTSTAKDFTNLLQNMRDRTVSRRFRYALQSRDQTDVHQSQQSLTALSSFLVAALFLARFHLFAFFSAAACQIFRESLVFLLDWTQSVLSWCSHQISMYAEQLMRKSVAFLDRAHDLPAILPVTSGTRVSASHRLHHARGHACRRWMIRSTLAGHQQVSSRSHDISSQE